MNADFAENIIATTGHLIGGEYTIDRPINANGAREISGTHVAMTPEFHRACDAEDARRAAAQSAYNEERVALRDRLADLGVSFEKED